MVDTELYKEMIETVQRAKNSGVECVLVFKPDVQEEQGEPESPDMIVCTSGDPKVIAALLGNYGNLKAE